MSCQRCIVSICVCCASYFIPNILPGGINVIYRDNPGPSAGVQLQMVSLRTPSEGQLEDNLRVSFRSTWKGHIEDSLIRSSWGQPQRVSLRTTTEIKCIDRQCRNNICASVMWRNTFNADLLLRENCKYVLCHYLILFLNSKRILKC